MFDLILAGDGSGTTVGDACGWHVFVQDTRLNRSYTLYGGSSSGTVNYAELYPYIFALWDYDCKNKKSRNLLDQIKVLILSDSELTVRCGSGEYERRANLSLWSSIDWFEKNGYELTWQHRNRLTTVENKISDEKAGKIRRFLRELVNDKGCRSEKRKRGTVRDSLGNKQVGERGRKEAK